MTVTIELTPELEQKLRQVAAHEGQDPVAFVNTFARGAITEKLQSVTDTSDRRTAPQLTLAEESRLLDELATGGENLLSLPTAANRREWIYGNHD